MKTFKINSLNLNACERAISSGSYFFNMEFIYSLTCPIENRVKYIGLTKNPNTRLSQHINNPSKNVKVWIDYLKASNKLPIMNILQSTTNLDGSILEKEWICKFDNLLNKQLNKEKQTTVYTVRVDTELLMKAHENKTEFEKSQLRKRLAKIINNYLKKKQ